MGTIFLTLTAFILDRLVLGAEQQKSPGHRPPLIKRRVTDWRLLFLLMKSMHEISWNNEEKLLLGHWRAAFAVQYWASWVRIKPVQCDVKMALKPFSCSKPNRNTHGFVSHTNCCQLGSSSDVITYVSGFRSYAIKSGWNTVAAQGIGDQPR